MDTRSALLGLRLYYFVFMLGMLGISIYGIILFIKLAHRGIKALDIYINEKNKWGEKQRKSTELILKWKTVLFLLT